jgi:hypothetical protein
MTRDDVITRFLSDCRAAHELAPAGSIDRVVRISDLRKTYRVPLTEVDLTLSRDDAMTVLAAAYRAVFHPAAKGETTMTTITLNIGLNTNDGATLALSTVAGELAELTNDFAIVRVEQSATEQTAIVQATGLTARSVYHLSVVLRQNCIAVSPDGGKTGSLIGPRADAWGWSFDPKFFIPA